MDISIITPAYNCIEYMDKAISSVVNQRGVAYEWILVDDGSTDGTSDYLDKLAKDHEWITVIHKENDGPGLARNVGIDAAKGKYIYFLDSDDWIAPGSLEYLLKIALREQADIICYGVKKTATRDYELTIPEESNLKKYENEEILTNYFRWMSATICKLFKREIFEKYRFEKVAICEDAWSMHLFFSMANVLVTTDAICYAQYIRRDSRSRTTFSDKNFIAVECGRRMVSFAKEHAEYAYGEALYNLIRRQLKMLYLIRENGVYKEKRTEYDRLMQELRSEEKEAYLYRNLHEDVWKRVHLATEYPHIYAFREQCKVIFHKWKK